MNLTSAAFWDKVARRYSEQPIADTEAYARKLSATQALMNPKMQVLELGCGTGSTALEHAPHVHSILATDVSAAMIKIAQEKAKLTNTENVAFEQCGVDDLAESQGKYDMVLALNLLHLLPNRTEALAKIHRLLKPGGLFISSTVCLGDKMWFLRPIIPIMQWLGKAPYVEFVHSESMLQEIAATGFEECEHWTHGRANSLFLITKKI